MSVAKIAVSMDERTVRRLDSLVKARVFRTRSEAIQKSVEEKLGRLDKSRLARECAKLSARDEQSMAEEGMGVDSQKWPEY